jgi:tripartite-type tricarboxylate transporter receptor subunit TctC
METVNMSPEQFSSVLRNDYNKWGKLIKDANIKLE